MIIDGKLVSSEIRKSISHESAEILKRDGKKPGLAVIIVGENPASQVYVKNKVKACLECGFESFHYALSKDAQESELIALINDLNANDDVNGILVQLPLPKHLDEQKILAVIDPKKDVDGFSATQMGRLALGLPALTACTPTGVIELLKYYNIDMSGKKAVVVGRSNIVGKPMALLLLQNNATVTIAHSRTRDIAEVTRQADILVLAIGKPGFVTKDMVKEGAVVIDVGINRTDNGLCGDVDYENVAPITSAITPVPGGVGPMTITMLMKNTITAYNQQNGR